MNLATRFIKLLKGCGCSHMRTKVIDRYPEEDWRDAGDDSNIHFARGSLKVCCNRCGNVRLIHREFITKDKRNGIISNL